MKETIIGIIRVIAFFTAIIIIFGFGIPALVNYLNFDNTEVVANDTNEYSLTAVVVKTDRENDIVTVKDFNGNLWEFYGIKDWNIDDICSMMMNDNGTETIYDDIIVTIR